MRSHKMQDDWEERWNKYLTEKFCKNIPESSFKLDLRDINFYISPLLATTSDGMKAIQKHNAKLNIF